MCVPLAIAAAGVAAAGQLVQGYSAQSARQLRSRGCKAERGPVPRSRGRKHPHRPNRTPGFLAQGRLGQGPEYRRDGRQRDRCRLRHGGAYSGRYADARQRGRGDPLQERKRAHRGFIIDAGITNPRRRRKSKRASPLCREACSAPGVSARRLPAAVSDEGQARHVLRGRMARVTLFEGGNINPQGTTPPLRSADFSAIRLRRWPGKGGQAAGDYAEQQSRSTRSMTTRSVKEATNALGQHFAELGYTGPDPYFEGQRQGRADQAAEVEKGLDDYIEQARNGLANDYQRELFDEAVKPQRTAWGMQIAQHAGQGGQAIRRR
jgi:hypothetical protein